MLIYIKCFIICGVLAASALVATARSRNTGSNLIPPHSEGTCMSFSCRKISDLYGDTMDRNIEPCNDFYGYTCGGWATQKPMPRYAGVWNRYELIDSIIEKRRQEMLESAPTSDDILPIQQAKKFYQSCTNKEARQSTGIKTIASILAKNGGWPMTMNLQDWSDTGQSWKEIDQYFVRLGADYAFFEVQPTLGTFEQPQRRILLQSPSAYRSPQFRENATEYQAMLQPIAEAFIRENGANVTAAQLKEDVDNLFNFQRALRNATEASSKDEISKLSLNTLDFHFSFLRFKWDKTSGLLKGDTTIKMNWTDILRHYFDLEGININGELVVSIETHYIYTLPEIWARQDERTIVNYIHWNFVSQALMYTSDEMRNNISVPPGRLRHVPRWRRCLRETEMTHTDGYWFAENFFGDDIQGSAQHMSGNVKKELSRQIENSNWLSIEAKAAVQKKLETINVLMGFPDWNKNRTAVEKHYEGLIIGDDYVSNILSFWKYEKKIAIRKYIGREQSKGWYLPQSHAQAAYDINAYTINIPASILQRPFFDPHLPKYVHYGTLGIVLGHEMGHAFDPGAIQFDANGNPGMLNPEMAAHYNEQSSCHTNQSTKYFKDKAQVNRTVAENIAYTIGIQSALGAYKHLKEKDESRPTLKLPDFENFSDDQMFFISFGVSLCELIAPEYERNVNNVHSPPDFRVNAGISNTPEFAAAFNCSVDSPMNPKRKCNMWEKSPAASGNELPSLAHGSSVVHHSNHSSNSTSAISLI